MKIALVSCAGPDDSNDPQQVADFLFGQPMVEIGVQLSRKREGSAEYPTRDWVLRFAQAATQTGGTCRGALHVNGVMCRDACSGNLPEDLAKLLDAHGSLWNRLQFNFDAAEDGIETQGVSSLIETLHHQGRVAILQNKATNTGLIEDLRLLNLPFHVLHDGSGGLGIRPDAWPSAVSGRFNAWAGGLGPATLAKDATHISIKVAKAGLHLFGVDAQRRLRSGEGPGVFDLSLARQFVAAARSWNDAQPRPGQSWSGGSAPAT